jgi:hypothetical protein
MPAAGHLLQEVSNQALQLYTSNEIAVSHCDTFEDPAVNKVVYHTLSLLTITAIGAPSTV